VSEAIESLGVTSAPALLGCRRRYELARRPSGSGGFFSIPAALGDLCHESLQRTTETRAILSEDWEEALGFAWEEALAQLSERSPEGSDPASWPGFKVAKARTRNVATRLREALRPLGGEVELICERRMAALDGRLIGKPDLVVNCEAGHWIVDYKTGSALDFETEQPREEYVAQLHLYAVLEHARSEAWPTRGILLPFSQRTVDLELEQEACERLAAAVDAAIEAFNQRAPEPQPAAPSISSCQWCGNATKCDAVWDSCDESWAPTVSLAQGTVAQVARSETGLATIVFDLEAGSLGHSRIAIKADPDLVAGLDSIQPGAQLRASGLRRSRGERTFSMAPWSQLGVRS
jgi:PD-(D/E)XK nuclease superfamily